MKNFILFAFMLFNNIAFSQQFKTSMLPEQSESDPDIIKFGDSYFALSLDMPKQSGFSANLDRSIHGIEIKKLNAAFDSVKAVKLSGGNRVFGPMHPMLVVVGEKLFLLYYKMIHEEDIKLYASELNPASLELQQEVEILNIKEKEKYLKFYMRTINYRDKQHYRFKSVGLSGKTSTTSLLQLSPDNSKIMVLWTSGWSNSIFYSVLDNNFKLLRTKTEEIKDTKNFYLSNGCVDNDGNVFLSIYFENNNKQKALLLVNSNKSISNEITVPGGEVVNVNMGSKSKTGGSIFIAGTYKENSDNLTGVFQQEYNVSKNKFENIIKKAFPDELVELLDKDGWANTKTKNYGVEDAIDFELLLNEDGTANLVGEFRDIKSKTTTDVSPQRFSDNIRSTTSTKEWILSGSILSISFGEKETRFSRIPKMRASAGTTFGDSFQAIIFEKKVIIFYNDHKSNLEKEIDKSPDRSDNYKNSVLAAAIINEDGSVKRTTVIDQSEENFLASTNTFLRVSEDSYTLLFYKIKSLGGVSETIKRATIKID